MNTLAMAPSTTPATVVRWVARILSAAIILFWGYFIVADLMGGDAGHGSRALNGSDYLLLTMMVTWLVGLAIAWKWELAGGAITLAALAIAATVNWRVLVFPGTLVAVAAGLFLVGWWMTRGRIPW